MRLPTGLVMAVLALVDAGLSASLPRSGTGRPEPLPPETSSDTLNVPLKRAKAAVNISIPSPPSTAPLSPPAPVPKPMDLSISYALSNSCLLYLTTVLSSSTFASCLPFSLLLTTSTSYASLLSSSLATGDLTFINNLIAYTASPQPSSQICDQYFSGVHDALSSRSNCASDLSQGADVPAIAAEAQDGIGNYKLMREASGLVDPDTGRYCYLQAVASAVPDDLYLWSIPSGTFLPNTSTPTCSKCSSLLLNHYVVSLNTTSTLNATILKNAINVVNNQCGSSFASYSAASRNAGSSELAIRLGMMGAGLLVALLVVGGVLI